VNGLRRHRLVVAFVALAAAGAIAACRSEPAPHENRFWTDDLALRLSSDPSPPRARERIVYKLVVRDKKTGEPVEGGEGRIFATSHDNANTWDSFAPGPELGTYYATLKFITAGEWAVAIQFRRDSTRKLDRMDWLQDVRAAREPGS
jgi:hypothetical protein